MLDTLILLKITKVNILYVVTVHYLVRMKLFELHCAESLYNNNLSVGLIRWPFALYVKVAGRLFNDHLKGVFTIQDKICFIFSFVLCTACVDWQTLLTVTSLSSP